MEQQSKKSATGLIVGLIAVVLIALGVVWWVNRDSNNENQAANSSQTQNTTEPAPEETEVKKTIVVVASETPPLSTLVTAVKAADLVATLDGEGPYTVFAPTNAAFEALPAGTLTTLLQPENKNQLAEILKYHVVAGTVLAQDLKDGQEITTVQGGKLIVKITDGKVQLVDEKGGVATVEQADVNASNGVVHVINAVLLPQ